MKTGNSSGCYVVDGDYNVINVNSTARELYPQLVKGKKCYTCLMGLDEPCDICPVKNGVKGPTRYIDPIRHITEIVDAVDIEIDGHNNCHALVFATVAEDAAFAATLPITDVELKQLALIKALTIGFLDVMHVNLTNGDIVLYRHNRESLTDDSIYKDRKDYIKENEDYIRKYVVPEDQEMMRKSSDLAYLREALKSTESLMIHYKVLLHNEIHYFVRTIVRIGNADDFEFVVIGVSCEDKEMAEREKNLVLQQNLDIVEHCNQTGLLTKEAFFIHGSRLMAENPDTDFDVCILRLSNISSIDHQYGHAATDNIIRLIGRLLKTYQEDKNCLAYLGDGLFISITENTDTVVRKGAIYGFRDRILEQSTIKNLALIWSIYISVRRDITLEEIYDKTVYALSTVSADMQQDYVEFDQKMMDQLDWDNEVKSSFKGAVENGEITAWYQPKYSAASRKIVGAEALVRWVMNDGTVISPARFVPVLEKAGMVNILDQEIFRQVCRFQSERCADKQPMLPISVNLSRASIFTSDIAAIYAEIAESYRVEPGLIPIEITESAAVRAMMIRQFADELIQKGFSLHMDDYGAGYSSMASLQAIPFEKIKLDKSLIDFIGNKSGESLLRHTIAFAQENGMSVVAEGVESKEQYQFLQAAGCDEIQGYYFSKPVPEHEFIKMLNSQNNTEA